MSIHVAPADDDGHQLHGTDCWCDPEVEWIDPDTGMPYPRGPLVVHNGEAKGTWAVVESDA